MPAIDLLSERLANQQLTRFRLDAADAVVRWLGAVQAQDYAGAKWAIGLRAPTLTDAKVEEAFASGRILRTHLLRPTWHFVTPDDIRWILALTAPRVHACNASYYRREGLDDRVFARSRRAIERALEGGRTLTRVELGDVLRQARIDAKSQRLALIVMHAELEGVICSGPRRDRRFTYALLDERAPGRPRVTREEALAELTSRYFASHGPATLRDFAWWSGLPMREVRTAVTMAGLREVETSGRTFWIRRAGPRVPRGRARMAPTAHLLPNYDEYLIAYKERGEVVEAKHAAAAFAPHVREFPHHLVIDGRLAGSWRPRPRAGGLRIETTLYGRLSAPRTRAVASAARRYADFLGLPVELEEAGR